MKWIVNNCNNEWQMNYKSYTLAKSKQRKEKIRQKLFEILQHNAMINQFNHNNK